MAVITNPLHWPSRFVVITILAFSILSLGGALISQYGFGLHPCVLCLYQRIPFGITISLTAFSLLRPSFAKAFIAVSGLAFLAGASIAFFHVGVEQHWWHGLEGCSTPPITGSVEDLLKSIETAPAVTCDQVAWSLFGISMAGYNAILSLIAGLGCLAWFFTNRRPSSHQSQPQ